jgi:ATP-dependent DNA helicase RecG
VCSHGFFTIQELEILLDKHRNYLMTDYIRPLVRGGLLQLRYPESAKHPHQAYVAVEDKSIE